VFVDSQTVLEQAAKDDRLKITSQLRRKPFAFQQLRHLGRTTYGIGQ
jgi:hypothetical protein